MVTISNSVFMMSEITRSIFPLPHEEGNSESVFDLIMNEKSPLKSVNFTNLTPGDNVGSDDENRSPGKVRRRIMPFSDSDSEVEADKENTQSKELALAKVTRKPNISSESDDDILPRIPRLLANSDSNDESKRSMNEQSRIANKRSKLHDKFRSLLNSRVKAPEIEKDESTQRRFSEHHGDTSSSDDSNCGIESIKQKTKQKSLLLKPGICDPDTSSDEEITKEKHEQRKKKPNQRSTILTSPKPARMSAKQAMENMQKIKSESNRMLREKEVSLPYHRPKALSLNDIMSRRKTALSADGKTLPVKMNSEQLKHYVKFLEERNKAMMELCKSDTEDEETMENTEESNPQYNPEEPIQDSIILEQKVADHLLPDVNVEEKKIEDDLPNLTVEVVQMEQDKPSTVAENDDIDMKDIHKHNSETDLDFKFANDNESQLIQLHYETEKNQYSEQFITSSNTKKIPFNESNENMKTDIEENDKKCYGKKASEVFNEDSKKDKSLEVDDNLSEEFSDVEINMDDLDTIIENAKNDTNTEDALNSPMLIRDPHTLNMKPKLAGAPGMVINLDGTNAVGSRKLTGVELLKERFTYFAKLKTPEEKERERELKVKPGMQHFKLKQELEDQISEQRSLEWAKRLADEKQQQLERDAVREDELNEDDIEKLEAKLDEQEEKDNISSESEEEEEICDVKDKPRKRNPMIDDEAEVSGDDEVEEQNEGTVKGGEKDKEGYNDNNNDIDEQDSDESSDDTSEDEEENQSKSRKGRILKAFEDSDDENPTVGSEDVASKPVQIIVLKNDTEKNIENECQTVKDSQDDVLPLAQTNKSISEDLFASQASIILPSASPYPKTNEDEKLSDKDYLDLGSQTFSILNTNSCERSNADNVLNIPEKLDVICETQPVVDSNLDDIVGLCSGNFTQTQSIIPQESQISESQCTIGDDILALCTGKFYDNQFVTQIEENKTGQFTKGNSMKEQKTIPDYETENEKDILDSILVEMGEPDNNETKTKKYVFDNAFKDEGVSFDVLHQGKKKFIIDSDDDSNNDATRPSIKKKFKKRKPEKRALQISDDEEEGEEEQSQSDEEAIGYMSDAHNDDVERIVEYDSEENEVEVKPQDQKKKRKMAEFFEQEAELTSEDEWVGSGDEDEAGLDRMEREAGDDDTFHEGQLQRELGQIHMRDVLDQDKREVRLIQELLFEDGDLGEGHRQRKFRWKNLDGEEDTGAVPNIFADSQEEEFESEEQWRKQRHEREVFLRNLQKENEKGDHDISIDRTTIIKANLCSKTMSSLLLEVNGTKNEEATAAIEKKKEEPKPLPVCQQSYHGSLLTRGRGALARLAALAMPLAGDVDDDAKVGTIGPSSKRNFVFTAVTPAAKASKVTKRKADNVNVGTPRLIKKLKTDDKQIFSKSSLLDHLRAL